MEPGFTRSWEPYRGLVLHVDWCHTKMGFYTVSGLVPNGFSAPGNTPKPVFYGGKEGGKTRRNKGLLRRGGSGGQKSPRHSKGGSGTLHETL